MKMPKQHPNMSPNTSNMAPKWGGFGGHVGAEVGKFGPIMATRWHLKPIGNDI